jgi:hypothetical protein
MWTLLVWALLVTLPATAGAQGSPGPTAGSENSRGQLLRVHLDCPYQCEFDFIRTEISFVDWVRSRQDADVNVLVTDRATGAGGREYTLRFLGQASFGGMEDELRFTTEPASSRDRVRSAMVHTLRNGLVRYAMHTSGADRIQVSYAAAPGSAPSTMPARDRWNSWVFQARFNGFFNGESSFQSSNMSGSLSASRTTHDWKTTLSVNTHYFRSEFDVGAPERIVSERRSYSSNTLAVRSLTDRLSAGSRASASHSTFENRDLGLRLAPAVEYNVFPYAESTRRQLTFQYSLGLNHVRYLEETIYFHSEQSLVDHMLQIGLGLRQPWGNVNTSLTGSQYLHNTQHYRLVLSGNVDLRLVRGLSLNLGGSAARIRDQLHLQRGTLTIEEIITRQRQLETSYYYFGSVGLSYSFGSIYNTVVNPRFAGTQIMF